MEVRLQELERPDALAYNSATAMVAVSTTQMEGPTWDGCIYIIGPSGDRIAHKHLPSGNAGLVWCGNNVAAGGDDGIIKVLKLEQIEDGSSCLDPTAVLAEHDDIITSLSKSLQHPSVMVSGSWDRSLKLWDLEKDTGSTSTLKGHTDRIQSVAFSSYDSNSIASGSSDCSIRLWDRRTSANTAAIKCLHSVLSLAWHPTDSNLLAAGSEDGSVTLFDVTKGAVSQTIPRLSAHDHDPARTGHSGSVYSLSFSHSGGLIASASDDTTVQILNVDQGSQQLTLRGQYKEHSDYVRSVIWSPDDTAIITGSWDHTVKSFTPA